MPSRSAMKTQKPPAELHWTLPLCLVFAGSVMVSQGCNLVDDEPPETTDGGESGGDGEAVCIAAIEAGAQTCMPPQQFWFDFNGASYNMLLIDDPGASVSVLGGLLLSVGGSADYIGTYNSEDPDCGVFCGWCQPGQNLCMSAFDAEGNPECLLCMAPSGDPSADQEACEDHLAVCLGAAESGTDSGGLDESGGADDESGGADDESGDDGGVAPYYDCAWWDPVGAVTFDAAGRAYIDTYVLDDVIDYFGHPLSQCDGTQFSLTSSGHFKISRLAAGGVLDQLGLQRNDVLVKSNGVELDDLEAIADLTIDLFYDQPASWFTLTYQRRKATHQLTVVLQ